MKVHHLDCGSMHPLSRRLINGTGGVFEPGLMVCHCLLVESPDGLVLVDTGIGALDLDAPDRWLARGMLRLGRAALDVTQTAAAQVERLGFERSDVRHVIVTHLDFDHAGGIADFPTAQVHVLSREHEAAHARKTLIERLRYHPAQWAHRPRWQLHVPEAGERWFGFERVRPIAATGDGVLLLPLRGHTRGHAAIAVKGDAGWLLHAGDAYFHHGQMEERPWVSVGGGAFERVIQMDRKARIENQARLRALALARPNEVRVFCAHDPLDFERARKAQVPSVVEVPSSSLTPSASR